MTGEVTLPNLGLVNGWTPGTDGWNVGTDANYAALDALVFLAVASASTITPPASPVLGARYICPIGSSGSWAGNDGKLAVYTASGWAFYTAKAGWRAYVFDAAADFLFDGAAWGKVANPYDIQIFRYNLPILAQEPIMSMVVVRALALPSGLTGSRASLIAAGAVALSFPIKQNGLTIGTVNFAGGQTAATFSFTSAISLVPGDVFEVYAPSPPDANALGFRAVIIATR